MYNSAHDEKIRENKCMESKNLVIRTMISLVIVIVLLTTSVCMVFAAPPVGTPAYGSTAEFNATNYYGPWLPSCWSLCGTAYRYSGWDADTENFYNAVPTSYDKYGSIKWFWSEAIPQ